VQLSLTPRPGSFASVETQDNFLAPPTSDCVPPSDLRTSNDQDEDRPVYPRVAACAVLAKLELSLLDKTQHEEQWKGQTIFKLPLSTLLEILSDIETVVAAATDCFAQEQCVLNIPQPCFVFGDIHGLRMRALRLVRRHHRGCNVTRLCPSGNFNDLKRFESIMWPLGVKFAAGSFLWLGDYVDRGSSCLVTILYLLCQKVLNPKKWRQSPPGPLSRF
jgi:hypothetical protein